MGQPIVRWEIVSEGDPKEVQKFYADLFGWTIDADNPLSYGLIDKADAGVAGGISGSTDPNLPGHVTVEVANDRDPRARGDRGNRRQGAQRELRRCDRSDPSRADRQLRHRRRAAGRALGLTPKSNTARRGGHEDRSEEPRYLRIGTTRMVAGRAPARRHERSPNVLAGDDRPRWARAHRRCRRAVGRRHVLLHEQPSGAQEPEPRARTALCDLGRARRHGPRRRGNGDEGNRRSDAERSRGAVRGARLAGARG